MLGPVFGSQQDDPGAPDEERAQVGVAALGDAPEDGARFRRRRAGNVDLYRYVLMPRAVRTRTLSSRTVISAMLGAASAPVRFIQSARAAGMVEVARNSSDATSVALEVCVSDLATFEVARAQCMRGAPTLRASAG